MSNAWDNLLYQNITICIRTWNFRAPFSTNIFLICNKFAINSIQSFFFVSLFHFISVRSFFVLRLTFLKTFSIPGLPSLHVFVYITFWFVSTIPVNQINELISQQNFKLNQIVVVINSVSSMSFSLCGFYWIYSFKWNWWIWQTKAVADRGFPIVKNVWKWRHFGGEGRSPDALGSANKKIAKVRIKSTFLGFQAITKTAVEIFHHS